MSKNQEPQVEQETFAEQRQADGAEEAEWPVEAEQWRSINETAFYPAA